MGLWGVVAYSDDLRTEVLEFLIGVPKLARLCSASFREVFRIEVYNYVLVSTKIFEANVFPIAGLEPESRSQTT
jgi:hypothetical protein